MSIAIVIGISSLVGLCCGMMLGLGMRSSEVKDLTAWNNCNYELFRKTEGQRDKLQAELNYKTEIIRHAIEKWNVVEK